jgi:hypothetical protein
VGDQVFVLGILILPRHALCTFVFLKFYRSLVHATFNKHRKTWLIKTNRNQVISVKMFDFQFHLKKLLLTRKSLYTRSGMPLSQARKDSLDSWQYKAATLILRRKLNIPKAAILLELGWEPLSVFIDKQRISYYKRLLRLPNHLLCKQVYNEGQWHPDLACMG